MFSLESVIFLISTLSILIFFYLHLSNNIFPQITALLLAITLIFITRVIFPHSQLLSGRKIRLLLLFLSSSLVQFLVISTGGFYSPFLILLHLYTLGTSFLFNSPSSIGFLVFAVIALGVNILVSPQLMSLFRDDPGPIILYSISFIVIIPLAQLLMSSYRLKDKLFHALKEYARIGEKREDSILIGLQEMVIVTDKYFNIISTNTAVEKNLKMSSEDIIGHHILKVLPLKDSSGNPADAKNFAPEQITENVARIINDLYFQAGTDSSRRKVNIQIRPIADSQGIINQIVVIIADASFRESGKHDDLAAARKRYQLLAHDLKQTLRKSHLAESATQVSLLEKIEEDLSLAEEIEDHFVEQTVNFCDIAYIAKQVIISKNSLASGLGILLKFQISKEFPSEKAILDLIDSNLPKSQLPLSDFAVATNQKWVRVIIEKLVEIAILLASETKNSTVIVTPALLDGNIVNISIAFPYRPFSEKEKEEIFQKYYGSLGATTSLRLGSGLEGFIAKTVAQKLRLLLEVGFTKETASLILSLKLSKSI